MLDLACNPYHASLCYPSERINTPCIGCVRERCQIIEQRESCCLEEVVITHLREGNRITAHPLHDLHDGMKSGIYACSLVLLIRGDPRGIDQASQVQAEV